jgi:hypothetical protein
MQSNTMHIFFKSQTIITDLLQIQSSLSVTMQTVEQPRITIIKRLNSQMDHKPKKDIVPHRWSREILAMMLV